MKKLNFKRDWKSIVGVIVLISIVVGIAGALIAMDSSESVKISDSEFEVGSIDTSTGKYIEDNQSIYTEKAFNCRGLRVEPEFTFSGTYDVFYYDYNEHFLNAKLGMSGVYDEDYPFAKLARVVIHPDVPADETESSFEISFWEIKSYAKLIDITVDKNQDWDYETLNLYDDTKSTIGHDFARNEETGSVYYHVGETYAVNEDASELIKLSGVIDISDLPYHSYDIFVKKTSSDVAGIISVVAASNKLVIANAVSDLSDCKEGEWAKLTINIDKLEDVDHMRIRLPADSECYVYGYNS